MWHAMLLALAAITGWFWALAATAVFSAGSLDYGLRAAPGPATGLLVLGSALLLVGSLVQAARILAALTAPSRPRPAPVDPRARDPTAAFGRPKEE
ncbi:hypothetical protein KV205_12270 [Streptomyces sp. SKN60]|uniref:hypothetical protein n=1 Tax=Streptomyces sp. SKN60 TaxID=2855506 RepID=UPI0022450856|nr:hypothetical protein [Streptomyces sp. SKN60]MCX2181299.1 hypothetical protein [Streptomyces sp. SKN60]